MHADFAAELERELMATTELANNTYLVAQTRREEVEQLQSELAKVTKERDALEEFFDGHEPKLRLQELRAALAEAQAKLDYVASMGLQFGMMKSSDKPEPYLAHVWHEDSDHERMFREWSHSIGWERRVEQAETELAATKQELSATKTERDKLKEEIGEYEIEAALRNSMGSDEALQQANATSANLVGMLDRSTDKVSRLQEELHEANQKLEQVVSAATKAGWDGVTNSKLLSQFILDQAELLARMIEHRDTLKAELVKMKTDAMGTVQIALTQELQSRARELALLEALKSFDCDHPSWAGDTTRCIFSTKPDAEGRLCYRHRLLDPEQLKAVDWSNITRNSAVNYAPPSQDDLAAMRTRHVVASGYGGLKDGVVVDRRQHPDAIPLQEHAYFEIPAPKDLP